MKAIQMKPLEAMYETYQYLKVIVSFLFLGLFVGAIAGVILSVFAIPLAIFSHHLFALVYLTAIMSAIGGILGLALAGFIISEEIWGCRG